MNKFEKEIEFFKEKGFSTSSDSPDSAKNILKNHIKKFGANAIIDLTYSKTTGNNGNYQYSVHNYSGTIALIGKKSKNGTVKTEDLPDLNKNAVEYKGKTEKEYDKRESDYGITMLTIFGILSVISLFISIINSNMNLFFGIEFGIIVLLLIIKIFSTNDNEGEWLQRGITS